MKLIIKYNTDDFAIKPKFKKKKLYLNFQSKVFGIEMVYIYQLLSGIKSCKAFFKSIIHTQFYFILNTQIWLKRR